VDSVRTKAHPHYNALFVCLHADVFASRSNGKETTDKNSACLIGVNFYLRRSALIPDMGM